MNLDQKLKELQLNPIEKYEDGDYYLSDSDIAQIKQAFQEAGYSKVKTIWHHPDVPVMTGPEWFERFKEELTRTKVRPNIVRHVAHTNIQDTVLEAAKRASGLTD